MKLLQTTVPSVAVLFLAVHLSGQGNTGSISGTITDPNGAVIPGAKVKAVADSTQQEFDTITSEGGIYVFPSVPPGPYTITVEHPGFKRLNRTGIEVRIATRQVVDLRPEVGDVQQSVEVTAEPPLLASTTSEIATNFSPTFMQNAPLFTGGIRNPSAFVVYMPGVNAIGDQSINGSPRRGKESLIDGASHTIPESGGVSPDFPLKFTFTINDKVLMVEATGQQAVSLEYFDKDKFRFTQAGAIFEFALEEKKMVFTQNNNATTFTRE
jgi:hypothetical protein